jgi:hypothetical protein
MQSTQPTTQFRRRISRDRSTKPLCTIIEYFDPTERRNLGTKRYRIPPHQRFDSWSLNLKQKLIDTILQDFPLGSVIVTRHFESGGHFYNIQDGQTRLTALYDFANNKFHAEDGRFFKDLSEEERARFRNYQMSWEIIEKTDEVSDREFEEIIADMFERLNSGKPLSDNDKFHARMSTSVMELVMSLKSSPDFVMQFKKYFWPDLGSGKTFTGLKEAAAIAMSIIHNCTDCITTSYKANGVRMVSTEVGAADIERVSSFLRRYFSIIERAIPNVAKPNRSIFNKIPSTLGMMLCNWIQTGGEIDDEMWIKFIKANHDHKHFIRTLFARVDDFDRRCATTSAFNSKIAAVIDAFSPTRSFDHVIAEITGLQSTHGAIMTTGAVPNYDSGSETETDNEQFDDEEEESD